MFDITVLGSASLRVSYRVKCGCKHNFVTQDAKHAYGGFDD
jgi:hypothetical protein